MSEYRTTATLTADGTFVVRSPVSRPDGTRAEVTLRVDDAISRPSEGGDDPIRDFYAWLANQPPRESTSEAEQATLRRLRDEWD